MVDKRPETWCTSDMTNRPLISTSTQDLLTARREYEQHLAVRDLDDELLGLLAASVAGIDAELDARTAEPWRPRTCEGCGVGEKYDGEHVVDILGHIACHECWNAAVRARRATPKPWPGWNNVSSKRKRRQSY